MTSTYHSHGPKRPSVSAPVIRRQDFPLWTAGQLHLQLMRRGRKGQVVKLRLHQRMCWAIASAKHQRCDRSPRRILLDGYRQPRLQWEVAVAVMVEVVGGHDLRKTSRGLSMPTSACTNVTYVHEIVNFEYRRQLPPLGSVFFELIVISSTAISPETLVLSSS